MNTYKKYCPNVFVAKCEEEQTKGDIITLTTRYGKENEHEVHNFLDKTNDNFYLYSITRVDGFNCQERAKNKADKLTGYASNAEKRSSQYYEASQEGRDFLSLGEPIKIGHHSENRHRKLIQRNWDRMGKSVAESDKAQDYLNRSEYWEKKAKDINLSMPESIEYYEFKFEESKKNHKLFKDKPELRRHSYSLTYAKKEVNNMVKNLNLAVKLWGSDEEINHINKEKEEEAKKKVCKTKKSNDLIKKYGGFFFFGSDVSDFKVKYNKLLESGHVVKGEKVKHISHGLYLPCKNIDNYLNEL